MTLEKYDELDRLNQLELAKIGKVAPVSLPSSLGLKRLFHWLSKRAAS